MTRVRERRPEQRIQAQVKAQKEAKLGRVKQGWKASRSGAKERTKRSGMRRRPCLSSLRNGLAGGPGAMGCLTGRRARRGSLNALGEGRNERKLPVRPASLQARGLLDRK